MLIFDVVNYLDERFPQTLASDFDCGKIGLTIGSSNLELNNVLLTLDLNLEVVQEAIKIGANLIISHHSFIFEPFTKVLFDNEKGKVLGLMFKHQISLYSMHTNLDVGINGVNDVLANLLGLKNIIGNVMKDSFLRYGDIKKTTLNNFATHVKTCFDLTGVKVAGPLSKEINKVGIIGGGGAQIEELDNALALGCDCFISGEVKLHVAQYALYNQIAIIEVNHGVEKLVFNCLRDELESRLGLKKRVYISKINTDPLIFL
jgi:dinuclear metal center YbgI/SA1388 family protein